jgi:iron complex transport system permease protein
MTHRIRQIVILVAFLVIAGLAIVFCAFIGMKTITPNLIAASPLDAHIFWFLRVPRVLTAFLAGSGLALCGMVFQALFRNPLADPFTLGTASGASCGASIMIMFGVSANIVGIPMISFGAFIGAAVAMMSVYGISSLRRSSSSLTMLLAGIAVSFMCSSLLMFLQYMSSMRDSFQIVRWLMGGIQVAGFGSLISMLPFWVVGAMIIFLLLPRLDQLLAGDDLAQSRGINVRTTKLMFLVATTLLVGGIVAVCGPIGFIGLMVPHLCRRFVSGSHLFLGPACILLGGTILVIADTIARTIIAPVELPVGIITALLGGPFFLVILFGSRSERGAL